MMNNKLMKLGIILLISAIILSATFIVTVIARPSITGQRTDTYENKKDTYNGGPGITITDHPDPVCGKNIDFQGSRPIGDNKKPNQT